MEKNNAGAQQLAFKLWLQNDELLGYCYVCGEPVTAQTDSRVDHRSQNDPNNIYCSHSCYADAVLSADERYPMADYVQETDLDG